MIFSDRAYNEYHRDIWRLTQRALESRKIPFDSMTLYESIPTSITDQLLLVWSEDVLWYSSEDRKRAQFQLHNLIDQKRPVLFLTSVDQVNLDFDLIPDYQTSLHFLHYGGDIMFQSEQYPKLLPQREKNFDGDYHWISLSRGASEHRVMTACCLLGYGMGDQTVKENHGLLRISNYSIKDFATWQQYLRFHNRDSGPITPEQNRLLQYGFDKLLDLRNGGQPDSDIYDGYPSDLANARNFDLRLRHLYRNSLVEIVNETVFFQRGIHVTEKFQNSVYAFNLPIIMNVPGTVDYLRRHGFDMFDDVINHEYDHVHDPVQRIFAAIESNSKLLTDHDYAISCWQQCLLRLEKNYQYIKKDMYRHFKNKFQSDLDHCLDSIQKGGS